MAVLGSGCRNREATSSERLSRPGGVFTTAVVPAPWIMGVLLQRIRTECEDWWANAHSNGARLAWEQDAGRRRGRDGLHEV